MSDGIIEKAENAWSDYLGQMFQMSFPDIKFEVSTDGKTVHADGGIDLVHGSTPGRWKPVGKCATCGMAFPKVYVSGMADLGRVITHDCGEYLETRKKSSARRFIDRFR